MPTGFPNRAYPICLRIVTVVVMTIAIAVHIVAAVIIPRVGIAVAIIVLRGFIPGHLAVVIGLAILIIGFAAAILTIVAVADRITDQAAGHAADSGAGDT